MNHAGYPFEANAPQARALVLDWLASQQQAMQDLLQKVVNIDSGSRDEAGVTAVAHALLNARRRQRAGAVRARAWLLACYCTRRSTLLGEGAPSCSWGTWTRYFPPAPVASALPRGSRRALRPGVADMKSDLVLNVFWPGLCTLRWPESAAAPVLSCDEEIGSPATRDLIMGPRAGRPRRVQCRAWPRQRNVVTSRKGSMLVEFEVEVWPPMLASTTRRRQRH